MFLHRTDEPIIRRALTRRLESLPGIKVLEVKVGWFMHDPTDPHIAVGVLLHVDDKTIARGRFDLEPPYALAEVHNQADQIAEQCKEARAKFRFTSEDAVVGAVSDVFQAKGTGLRGHWKSHNIRRIQ